MGMKNKEKGRQEDQGKGRDGDGNKKGINRKKL